MPRAKMVVVDLLDELRLHSVPYLFMREQVTHSNTYLYVLGDGISNCQLGFGRRLVSVLRRRYGYVVRIKHQIDIQLVIVILRLQHSI